ncbi:MAG TPA: hypothetical protein VF631_13185 [Allosphingosinicella sp.]|uniref:hypothetical protein n=1 Tax=Allosphingosinicella sp. TaxID=2823234 RepID=UPI002F2AD565
MVEVPPPSRRGRGCNMVMLLLLLALIAGLAAWAFLRNPPSEPSAAGTAIPKALPGGGGNTAQP